MMTRDARHRETLLREVLFSALDAVGSARTLESPMLIYLAEMMVQRARTELYDLRAQYHADPASDPALRDDRRFL